MPEGADPRGPMQPIDLPSTPPAGIRADVPLDRLRGADLRHGRRRHAERHAPLRGLEAALRRVPRAPRAAELDGGGCAATGRALPSLRRGRLPALRGRQAAGRGRGRLPGLARHRPAPGETGESASRGRWRTTTRSSAWACARTRSSWNAWRGRVWPPSRPPLRFLDRLEAAGRRLAVISASENAAAMLTRGWRPRIASTSRSTGSTAGDWDWPASPTRPSSWRRRGSSASRRPSLAVVEDALAGVEAGARGGFGFVIGVDRVGYRDELLAAGASVVVSDLGELLALARRHGAASHRRG